MIVDLMVRGMKIMTMMDGNKGVSHNVSQICDGRDLEAETFTLTQI